MRGAAIALVFLGLGSARVAVGCSSPSDGAGQTDPAAGTTGAPTDAGKAADSAGPSTATDGATPPSAGDAAGTDAGFAKTYRNSLGVCWTDPTCKRALSVAHGGEWTFNGNAYDSNAAIAAAYAHGADAIKIDGRISKDGVVIVAHSSPFAVYESVDCYNKKIEEMTAAQATSCHRVTPPSETYQRLDDVLNAVRGKLVVQICVKLQSDTAGIAAAVLAAGAEDFAFLEISTSDLQTLVPPIPNGNKLWYLINVSTDLPAVDTLLDTIKNPRAFMYEFEPNMAVDTLVTTRLHPAGIRSFTYDKNASTTPAIKALFDAKFDVVSTNANVASVAARVQVNTAQSITPP
jgi:glycerophosphoryl diester phosphodiesterase